jgi:ElaB/YqjD/DUF883 family membrane-anchored ribosome-binding protein
MFRSERSKLMSTPNVPNRNIGDFPNRGITPTTGATSMMEKAAQTASSLGEKAKDVACSVGEKAQEVAHTMTDKLETGGQYVRDQGMEAVDQFTALIRRHPLPALLIAFGAGVLFSQLRRD